jgi:membrane-associated phospholipid phosphatase
MTARQWLDEAERLDVAVYAAIARTDTPTLDRAMRRLSRSADFSRVWMGIAALLALMGGGEGRRAARDGLASIAVTSAIVNAVFKRLGRRTRPDVIAREVPVARHVRMPVSSSFPSGHSASGFSFATAVAATRPASSVPLHALAACVAYSRVHTGVHYPGDVLVGSLLGVSLAQITIRASGRRQS